MPNWFSATTLIVLVVGFLSGILAAVLGVGGAVITTPLIRFLGATPIAAVGSTVPAILPGAVAGSLRYHKEGYLDRRVALTVGLSGMACAVLGAWVADIVDARWLMIVTAFLVLWSGGALLRDARSTVDAGQGEEPIDALPGPGAAPDPAPTGPADGLLVVLGVLAGFLAGLLGVGGGIVLTPGLTLLGKMPVKHAVASSLAAVALMSTTALVAHVALGHVDWRFAAPLAIGIVPGARVGSRITVAASDRRMRHLTGLLLVIIALIYLAREALAF